MTDTLDAKPVKKMGLAKKGCLGFIGLFIFLGVLGALLGDPKDAGKPTANSQNENVITKVDPSSPVAAEIEHSSPPAAVVSPESSGLTFAQENAARTARQYIEMSGFSRSGLIAQLSSDAGDGYSLADATAAVASLDVDWNDQAARSAKQYLQMTGFSCKGLIQQLSSSAGDKYTADQAAYGAKQAGAC
jgi:Host cell surface-exposed lipoprotein